MCVYLICTRIAEVMDEEQKAVLRRIRATIDRVYWSYALRLIFGGMERTEPPLGSVPADH